MQRVYIKYYPSINIPTNEAFLPNQRDNEVEALASTACVTNKDNYNQTTWYKYVIWWHFRLVCIGYQNVQWLIHTGLIKVQVNTRYLDNCEITKFSFCEFGNGHHRPDKINSNKKNPIRSDPVQDVPFFYTPSHFSSLQSFNSII